MLLLSEDTSSAGFLLLLSDFKQINYHRTSRLHGGERLPLRLTNRRGGIRKWGFILFGTQSHKCLMLWNLDKHDIHTLSRLRSHGAAEWAAASNSCAAVSARMSPQRRCVPHVIAHGFPTVHYRTFWASQSEIHQSQLCPAQQGGVCLLFWISLFIFSPYKKDE